jgi:hypothetical protein
MMPGAEINSPDPAVTIAAAQVVFANVEVEQSPLGHRGFQTVFYSEDHIDREVLQSEIEPALQYFPRNGYGPDKSPPAEFVFFPLSSKQIAVGRITPVLDQVDKFGRKKMVFAHVLVFDAIEFLDRLSNNAFVVLDANPFFCSYQEVVDSEGVTCCRFNIPQRSLALTPREPAFDPSKMPTHLLQGDALLKLLRCASATARRKGFTLEIHGQSGPILEFIRSLFAVIPPEFRSACSFDTSFVGDTGQSKTSRSAFWANGVGKGQRLQQNDVIRIDLEKNESGVQEVSVETVTPFERWLQKCITTSGTELASDAVQRRIRSAAFLQDLLWGRQQYSAGKAGIEQHSVFEEFLECNEDYITKLLTTNFSRLPGEVLAERLTKCALTWIKATGCSAFAAVPRRFSNERLCEWLLPIFKKQTEALPATAELEALKRCFSLDNAEHTPSEAEQMLRGFYFYSTSDWQQLRNLLSTFDQKNFSRIAAWLVGAANLKVEARAYLSNRVKLFFGFVGKRYSDKAKTLLRVLTFVPLSLGDTVPSPRAGKRYCRRVVLRLLTARNEVSKKKHDVITINSTASTVVKLLPTPKLGRVIGNDSYLPWAVFQISTSGAAVMTGWSTFPLPRVPLELPGLLPALCLSGDHHFVFFRINDIWVIGELRKNESNWTALTVILDSSQFGVFQYNPFDCMKHAFGAFVSTSHSQANSSDIANQPSAAKGMLLLASRGSKFRIRGQASVLVDVVRQLFQILPDRLRMRCTYFSGRIPEDSPIRSLFLIEGAALNSSDTVPVFETQSRCWSGLEDFEPATPFEMCVHLAPRQATWPESWAVDQRMFHQFFELTELLENPIRVPVTERFTESAVRIFVSLNKNPVRESLRRLLRRDVGEALTASLLNRAFFGIVDHPETLPLILRNGFERQWLVSQTGSWLLDEQVDPVTNDQLHDIKDLHMSCGSDKSLTTWRLRALYASLAGKSDQLAWLIAILEDEHGDDADDSLLSVWQRSLMNVEPFRWEFGIEESASAASEESATEIGVRIEFHDLGTLDEKNLASRIVPALFGCEIDSVRFENGPHLKPHRNVCGRFWPLLIDALHEPDPMESEGDGDVE